MAGSIGLPSFPWMLQIVIVLILMLSDTLSSELAGSLAVPWVRMTDDEKEEDQQRCLNITFAILRSFGA